MMVTVHCVFILFLLLSFVCIQISIVRVVDEELKRTLQSLALNKLSRILLKHPKVHVHVHITIVHVSDIFHSPRVLM